ncbi:MAG: hypothetical protein AAGH74_02045 [Pseudomonadota bacterium]
MLNQYAKSWITKQFKRYARCENGQMSIEFALMMPLYAFVLVGSFQFWDAFRSSSKTAKIAYALSDIASRHESFDNAKADEIADVADKMLDNYLDRRRLRISNICYEDDRYAVQWSVAYKGTDISTYDPIVEADLIGIDSKPLAFLPTMAPQESIILLELEARWRPLFSVGLVDQTWSFQLITRPRFVDTSVKHDQLNNQTICPTVAEAAASGSGGATATPIESSASSSGGSG